MRFIGHEGLYPPLVLTQRDAPQTWNPAPTNLALAQGLFPRVRGRAFSETRVTACK